MINSLQASFIFIFQYPKNKSRVVKKLLPFNSSQLSAIVVNDHLSGFISDSRNDSRHRNGASPLPLWKNRAGRSQAYEIETISAAPSILKTSVSTISWCQITIRRARRCIILLCVDSNTSQVGTSSLQWSLKLQGRTFNLSNSGRHSPAILFSKWFSF